jgi:hypothetical protein
MDGRLPADMQVELDGAGTADLVVGFPTAGPSATAPALAAAIRSGLETHFSGHSAVVVHVDQVPSGETETQIDEALGSVRLVRVRPSPAPGARATAGQPEWDEAVQTILAMGRRLEARATVVLNPEVTSTTRPWSIGLGEPILKEDYGLVLPVYQRSRYEGTLTHALVVPLIRALFGKRLGHPVAEEFGCSAAAADALLEQDVWGTDLAHTGLEFWLPVAAIEGGLSLGQAALGPRTVPAPGRPAPLGPTVGRVAGALFTLAERFDTTWLDVRGSQPVSMIGTSPEMLPGSTPVDPERMLHGFRQGVRDLYPIWERILAPDNLGEVLVLSQTGPEEFRFPDPLWARVVYDFLLAHRARVLYRSHVAQSLAPLYLGRTASVFLETRTGPAASVGEVAERLGHEFEEQKAYLVDRWQ